MGGIAGYAAVLFCGLYLALARRAEAHERREYLTFALTCVAVAGYDLSCVGLYSADSLEQGVFWMRGNLLTASWIGIAYQAFVWDFIGLRMPKPLRAAAYALAVLGDHLL